MWKFGTKKNIFHILLKASIIVKRNLKMKLIKYFLVVLLFNKKKSAFCHRRRLFGYQLGFWEDRKVRKCFKVRLSGTWIFGKLFAKGKISSTIWAMVQNLEKGLGPGTVKLEIAQGRCRLESKMWKPKGPGPRNVDPLTFFCLKKLS